MKKSREGSNTKQKLLRTCGIQTDSLLGNCKAGTLTAVLQQLPPFLKTSGFILSLADHNSTTSYVRS